MYEKSTYTTILEAVTPIAHHSEAFGNTSIVMAEPVFLPDGSRANVPIITGDAMRHGLRDAAARVFLDAAGLLEQGGLTESALRLLFSGGQIGGASGATISITEYRRLTELVPSLGLLGGCAGNRMHPGRLQVNRAVLICKESMSMLGHDAWLEEQLPREASSARDHIELVQRVRMDPTLNPTSRAMLSAESADAVGDRMLASESASESGDAVAVLESKSSMMPRSFEIIAAGSRFAWSVTATIVSPLDRDTFDLMLAAWLSDIRVGGKQGTGHGRMVPVAGSKRLLGRPSRPATEELPDRATVGELFRAHVSERSEEIREFLSKVKA